MIFGRLSNTQEPDVNYEVELDFNSGLDEKLRYTRNGHRRTDAEISGIMKKRYQKRAEARRRIQAERKSKDKAQTLLLKKLRGSGFEELVEGDFCKSLDAPVIEPDSSNHNVGTPSMRSEMREKHK